MQWNQKLEKATVSLKTENLFHSLLRLLRLKQADSLKVGLKYIALWRKALTQYPIEIILETYPGI